jgi:hypothetical protein
VALDRGFPPLKAEAGWGDAAVVIPWVLYGRHGDAQLMADQWGSVTSWLAAFESRAGAEVDFPDGGFMFGDWLDAAAPPDNPAGARTPWPCGATACLTRSARIMALAAEVLGLDGGAFAALAERAAARTRAEFVTPNGRLVFPSQTAYALALELDLLSPEQRANAGRLLAQQVAADGYRIATGFLGTAFVTDALTNSGELATAYELLQRENPSRLYPVTMGATTIWERWDSMLPDGSINPGEMTSFNHYAFGADADWLHRTVGGLAPAAPGYRKLRIAPRPGPGITSASTARETPYGTASVAWALDGTAFALDISVPPNTTAQVSLPDGSAVFEVGSGRHSFAISVTEAQPMDKPKPVWTHRNDEAADHSRLPPRPQHLPGRRHLRPGLLQLRIFARGAAVLLDPTAVVDADRSCPGPAHLVVSVAGAVASRGIFAPTLRHHDGRFWMITTNMTDHGGHLLVTAEDPTGPWSEPVRIPGALGIDPIWPGTKKAPATSAPWPGRSIVAFEVRLGPRRPAGRTKEARVQIIPRTAGRHSRLS